LAKRTQFEPLVSRYRRAETSTSQFYAWLGEKNEPINAGLIRTQRPI
jgi:hypothetical protein